MLRNESAIDDSVENATTTGTITIDNPPRQGSFGPRLRKASFTGFARAATFERVLNNAFGRRRDESPSSRRSTQTEMTLPYFSFQPTIGRNSVRLLTIFG